MLKNVYNDYVFLINNLFICLLLWVDRKVLINIIISSMKYFNKPTYNAETLKKEMRKLAFTLHPDRGWNEAEFIAMNKEYEEIVKKIQNGEYNYHKSEEAPSKSHSYRTSTNNNYRSYRDYKNNKQEEVKKEENVESKTESNQNKKEENKKIIENTVNVPNFIIDIIFIVTAIMGVTHHIFIGIAFLLVFFLINRVTSVKKYSIIVIYAWILSLKNESVIKMLSVNIIENMLITWFVFVIIFYLLWALNSASSDN